MNFVTPEVFFHPNSKVSKRDLMLAATALVDAAICRLEEKEQQAISGKQRASMILAVFEDPSITPMLFDGSAWNKH